MAYKTGDVVRFKFDKHIYGLHEVVGYTANGQIILTANESTTEFYEDEKYLILVCSADDRKDL